MPESQEVLTARLEERFLALEKKTDDHHAELVNKINVLTDDHEQRIRVLERFRWILVGALLAAQAVGDIILYLLTHHK